MTKNVGVGAVEWRRKRDRRQKVKWSRLSQPLLSVSLGARVKAQWSIAPNGWRTTKYRFNWPIERFPCRQFNFWRSIKVLSMLLFFGTQPNRPEQEIKVLIHHQISPLNITTRTNQCQSLSGRNQFKLTMAIGHYFWHLIPVVSLGQNKRPSGNSLICFSPVKFCRTFGHL